jgi:hypothetical protein
MTCVQGDEAPAERQKMWKKLETSSTKTIAEQSMSSLAPLERLRGNAFMEALLFVSVTRTACRRYLLGKNYRDHIREYSSSVASGLIGVEIKWTLGNDQILFPDTQTNLPFGLATIFKQENKPVFGQLYILDSAEGTTKRLENQRNLKYMAEIMRRVSERLRRFNQLPVM